MSRVLVLFAHPLLEESRVHRRLVREIAHLGGITLHDLYETYPYFDVNVAHEQQLLLDHDLIIFQFPFYWYSTPALLKQWQDLVLEHGWAYGTGGAALRSKRLLCIVSTGGAQDAYQQGGYNRFTMRQLLAPIEQTAFLCKMDFVPPYVLHGAHTMTPTALDDYSQSYVQLLSGLQRDLLDWEQLDYDALTLNPFVSQCLTEVRA